MPRLREYVQAIRAVWQTWQTGEKLNFRGQEYKLTLMTPFFAPGPIEQPNIPIFSSLALLQTDPAPLTTTRFPLLVSLLPTKPVLSFTRPPLVISNWLALPPKPT